MRLLFGILLAVSILLFVALQWGGALTGAGKVNPAGGEMNAEKIILLDKPMTPADVAKLSAPVPVPALVPTSAPAAVQLHATASAVQAAPPAPVPSLQQAPAVQQSHEAPQAKPLTAPPAPGKAKVVPPKPEVKLCMSWGEFSGTDLARAEKVLAAMSLSSRLSQHEVEYESGYWVFIPPQKSKAAINKTIAELKAAGIEEYFVLKDSRKYHNAISLGIFKSEESARHLQAAVRKKGFRHVQLAERKGKLKYVVFDISELNEAESSRLEMTHKDFPGSELKKASCHAR